MQEEGEHMVVVEEQRTAGLRALEEDRRIVGDMWTQDQEDIIRTRGRKLRGGYAIADLNEAFHLNLPEDDYTTIAGFMLGRLGRIAVVGDEVRVRAASLRVLAVEGRRIERVALSFRPVPETGEPVEAQVSDAG
jgi:putative hemolysin